MPSERDCLPRQRIELKRSVSFNGFVRTNASGFELNLPEKSRNWKSPTPDFQVFEGEDTRQSRPRSRGLCLRHKLRPYSQDHLRLSLALPNDSNGQFIEYLNAVESAPAGKYSILPEDEVAAAWAVLEQFNRNNCFAFF
jgi:hypothetical protein